MHQPHPDKRSIAVPGVRTTFQCARSFGEKIFDCDCEGSPNFGGFYRERISRFWNLQDILILLSKHPAHTHTNTLMATHRRLPSLHHHLTVSWFHVGASCELFPSVGSVSKDWDPMLE